MTGNRSAATKDAPHHSRRELVRDAFRNHGAAVYSVAQALSSPLAAAEVTSNVFLRFSSDPDRYDASRGSLRAFLLSLTHDAVRSEPRSNRPERPGTEPDPAAVLEQLLAGLRDDERKAIVTVSYGGCTAREAAAVLGRDDGDFTRTIGRALRSLSDARNHATSVVSFPGGAGVDAASRTADELSEALATKAAMAQAEGMIMERDGAPGAAADATPRGRRRSSAAASGAARASSPHDLDPGA